MARRTVQPETFAPRIREVLDRIEALEPTYASAVQRIITRGSPISFDLLIRPVNAAREQATAILGRHEHGAATEDEVVEAYNAVAKLSEMVVGEGR